MTGSAASSGGEDISRKIRFLLQTQGIPYSKAAEWLGLPDDDFQEIVDGVKAPTARLLQNLAELCSVSPDFFTGKKEQPRPADQPWNSGQSPPALKPGTSAKISAGGPAKPGSASKPAATGKVYERIGPAGPVTLRDLVVRFQALLECLLDRGVITALDYKRKVEEVGGRAAHRSPSDDARQGSG